MLPIDNKGAPLSCKSENVNRPPNIANIIEPIYKKIVGLYLVSGRNSLDVL